MPTEIEAGYGSVAPARSGAAHVLTMTVLMGIVAVLTGAAIAVTLPPPADPLEQLYPLDPGITWVYDVTVNAEPSGRRYSQVLNRSQVLEVEGATDARAVQDRYDADPVTGEASARISYLAHRGDRLLLLGERDAFGYLQNFPPRIAYQAPAQPGTTWTWTNEFDAEASIETTLVGFTDVEAAGARFSDCQHLRRTTTSSFAEPEVTEEWVCPDVGPVRRRNETLGTDEILVAFRSSDLALGDAAVFAAAQPAQGVAVAGTGPARAQAAPGNLDTTAPLWTTVHKDIVQFPPLLRDGLLIVADETGAVSVTDTRTGQLLWRHKVADPLVAAPLLAGDVIVVADGEGALRGLDLNTGATRWWHTLPALATTLTVDGDVAVVTARDRTIRGITISDGTTRWAREIPGLVVVTPAVIDGVVVVGDETGAVTAVAVADGSVRWDRVLEGAVVAGPAIEGDRVVVGDASGAVSSLALGDGAVRWSEYIDSGVVSTPAVTDTAVVLVGDEVVRSYAAEDGALQWEADLPAPAGPPAIALGDEILVVSTDGQLMRFAAADGRLTQTSSLPRPDEESGVLTERPMVVADEALVIVMEAVPPLAFSFVMAYPLAPPEATGVHFTAEFHQATAPPVTTVEQVDGGEIVMATELGGVEVVSPGAPPRSLLPDGGTAPYAVAAGDIVVAQKDQELVAVPLAGGEPLWRVPVGEPVAGSRAVIAGDVVVAPADGGATLLGVDLTSGEQRWLLETGGAGAGRPLLLPDGDVVFGVGGLVRLDPTTGSQRWRNDNIDTQTPLTIVRDSVIGAGTVDDETTLFAVGAGEGELRWEYAFEISELAGPAAAGDLVIVADAKGFVGAADAVTGEVIWTTQLRTPPSATPAVLGDVVVLGEQGRPEDFNAPEDRLVALEASSGRYLGSYQPFATSFTSLYPAFTALDDHRIALWHLPDLMVLGVQR